VEREIFVPVIKQAGLDPNEAGCRLNWECRRDLKLN